MRTCFLFIGLFISLYTIKGQTLFYVNHSVSAGANDGSSWENAFPDLQMALAAASYGDTLWVAQGVYYPTNTTNRSISFKLKNGVKIYGGFQGTENLLNQRDWNLYKTILSGDIGTTNYVFDNSYHVLFGRGLDKFTEINGFVVEAAYAANAGLDVSYNDAWGGGLLLLGSLDLTKTCPIIANCIFKKNYAALGGGIYCSFQDTDFPDFQYGLVNPILKNCRFEGNFGSAGGGGMMKVGPTAPGDTLDFDHCTFYGNWSSLADGGGLYLRNPQNSSIRMSACVFEKDSALTGGGLTYYTSSEGYSRNTLLLDSCIFKGNVALEGSGLYFEGAAYGTHHQFALQMTDCLFESNRSKNGSGSAYLIRASDNAKIWASLNGCQFLNNRTAGDRMTELGVWNDSEVYLDVSNSSFIGNDPNKMFTVALLCGTGGTGENNIGKINVNNCLFARNGGGVAMLSSESGTMDTHIRNCTFFNNHKYVFTKSNFASWQVPNHPFYNFMYIDNCIVWEPRATSNTILYNNIFNLNSYFQFRINHCMFTLDSFDILSHAGGQLAFQTNILLRKYPEFMDTLSGDFRLQTCSPLRGRGNNSIAINANLLTDLDGLSRIRFGTVDLGAYEVQDSCLEVAVYEPASITLEIWPNPSLDGHIAFRFPEMGASEGSLSVFNLLGQEIYYRKIQSNADKEVDLSHLMRGSYWIQFKFEQKSYLAKWLRL